MLFMKGTPAEPRCKFSRATCDLLEENGIKYASFDILQDEEVRQGLKAFSNWPTYPQFYANGALVGGPSPSLLARLSPRSLAPREGTRPLFCPPQASTSCARWPPRASSAWRR